MDCNLIRENVEAIQMPKDMRARMEASIRTRRKSAARTLNRNPLAIAAALALCLFLPSCSAAAGLFGHFEDVYVGHFEDVYNWRGAVVGTKYENATEEIDAYAQITDSGLTVTAVLLLPEKAPYPYIEFLSIGSYTITDARGTVLAKGEDTAAAALDGDQAQISLPLDCSLPEGCILKIRSFISNAETEQPLPISGNWEIPIQ